MTSAPPAVLVFAATDPSGGAGLQADLMTLLSMGCHPLSVVTAVTVQDTTGVEDVLPIDAECVTDQARTILEDVPVAVFKLGSWEVWRPLRPLQKLLRIIRKFP